jgi:hypothetical protein
MKKETKPRPVAGASFNIGKTCVWQVDRNATGSKKEDCDIITVLFDAKQNKIRIFKHGTEVAVFPNPALCVERTNGHTQVCWKTTYNGQTGYLDLSAIDDAVHDTRSW